MKVISILKAIASGLIWGLGQLFNGQFIKAILLFGIFLAFIGTEFLTSNYFVETSAYDKVPGEDYGDLWVTNKFVARYNDMVFRDEIDNYDDFDAYIVEIGGFENLTEALLIEFVAEDLLKK